MAQSYSQFKAPFQDFKYVKGKTLLFTTCIWADGMGDLGPLEDLSSPRILEYISQKIGLKIGNEPDAEVRPYYVVGCIDNKKVVSRVMQSLYESGIYQINDKKEWVGPVSLSTYPDTDSNRHMRPRWQARFPEHCGMIAVSAKSEYITGSIFDRSCTTQIYEHGPYIRPTGDLKAYCKKMGYHPNEYSRTLEYQSLGDYGQDFRVILSSPAATTLTDKARALADLQNRRLVFDLVGEIDEEKPDLAKLETFLRENLFVPAYFKDSIACNDYLYALCTSPEVQNYQNVCLYSNQSAYLNEDKLRKLGFSAVISHSEKEKPEIRKISDVIGNRTLHLYRDYDLTNFDYYSLFEIAQKYAACSGDKTLEYCLSNQLVFVSQVVRHKGGFYDALVETLSRYTENANILEYLKLLNTSRGGSLNSESLSKMMALAATESFDKDWKSMSQQFLAKHNFLDIYPEIIRKNLMIYEFLSAVEEKDNSHAEKVLAGFSREELQNLWGLTVNAHDVPEGAEEMIKEAMNKRGEEQKAEPVVNDLEDEEKRNQLKK